MPASTIEQLDPRYFNEAVRAVGKVPAAWWRDAGPCPRTCDSLTGYTPDPDCPVCHGMGRIIVPMTLNTSGPTGGKLLLYQANLLRVRMPLELAAGDIICNYLDADFPFNEGDRVQISTREDGWQEQLQRGAGSADLLWRPPATRVLTVYDQAGLVAPSNYALNGDGTALTWSGSVNGGVYTALYRYRPTYVIVQGSIHHREECDDGSQFPARCVLRLWQRAPTEQQGPLM